MKSLFGEKNKYVASLSYDLFSIENGSVSSYGGSQNMYESLKERKCGCGIAGAADIILYIEALAEAVKSGNRTYTADSKMAQSLEKLTVSKERFLAASSELRKKYMPIIPGRGVNSFILAWGLNRYFKKHKMPYRSRWKWTALKKWKTVERMLNDDIPVILAIGNNFPFVWGKKELNLYVLDGKASASEEAVYRKEQSVCGHFVVVTAIEENCLTVSSWGRKYYINIDEYNAYVARHSIHLYSNILEIKKTRDDIDPD